MKLMKGDCLDRFKEIEAGSIDFICADMPYGTTQCKWDSCIPLDLLWVELSRVIKPNGAIALFAQTPFDKILGASNLKNLKYEWVWEKTAATGFLNAKKMPLKAHENILIFYKSLPDFYPIKTTGHVRKTSSRQELSSEVYGAANKKTNYDSTERYPRSVIKFSSDKQRESLHPTQKPLALIEYLVQSYSAVGDQVLDFCMGSGTTGVACQNLGREFIGIEKDEKYFEIASLRINKNKEIAA